MTKMRDTDARNHYPLYTNGYVFFKSIQTVSLESLYRLGKTRIFDKYFLTDIIQVTGFIYSIFGDTILIAFKNIVQNYNYRT